MSYFCFIFSLNYNDFMLFIVLVFGLIIGSFLNVVILRYGTGESIFKGKSRCMSCGKKLSWRELIPVLSFIIQKGRCRSCQSKISPQYPAIELIIGIVFVLVALKIWNLEFGIWNFIGNWKLEIGNFNSDYLLSGIYYWIIFSFLIIISVYDIRHKIIPNEFVYPFIIISLLSPLFNVLNLEFVPRPSLTAGMAAAEGGLARIWDFGFGIFLPYLASGILLFIFFALLWLISHGRWMGFGDAKLALAIGFFLGPFKTIIAFLFSFWLGAAFGIALMVLSKGKIGLKSQIPFGPFLALGAFLVFMIQTDLYNLLYVLVKFVNLE